MDKQRVITVLKYIGLIVGCIAKFTSGSLFVFNAYQNAIKSMFNYTQSEVELLSSALNLGLGTGFLPGMLYDRFGPFWTSGAGLLISGGSYGLIWSTTLYVDYYKYRSGLMALYFYLAGFGSLFSYMAALNTNVINFSSQHRGKIIGLLNACFTGSPSVFALLYYHLFSSGDYTVVENQDYPGFMLFFTILFLSMNLLCMVFLHDVTKLESTPVINNVTPGNNIQEEETVEDTEPILKQDSRERTLCSRFLQLLKNPNFIILSIAFTSAGTLGLINTNNITVITKSVGLTSYDKFLLVFMPIVNTIVSLAAGPLSDKVKDKFSRLKFFLIACVLFTITELIFIFFTSHIEGIITGMITVGFGIGILWTLVPTIVSEMFGISEFGRNWGILLMLSGLGSLGGQYVFGKIYDSQITVSGSLYCYGTKCFTYVFIFMAILGVVSIILSAVLDIRNNHRPRNTVM